MPTVREFANASRGREKNREDHLEPEDQIVDRAECDLYAAQAHIGVRNLRVTIQPLAFALALPVEQLEALDGPHRLDEG